MTTTTMMMRRSRRGDEDDDDLFQELRDIAFKFSSAMTGVTESPARYFHHLHCQPLPNHDPDHDHCQLFPHHDPDAGFQVDDMHSKGRQCFWLRCCS